MMEHCSAPIELETNASLKCTRNWKVSRYIDMVSANGNEGHGQYCDTRNDPIKRGPYHTI